MLPFEFVIDGPPVSQQTRRRERLHEWRQKVREEAEKFWIAGEPPHAEQVFVTITYFYDSVPIDVDNIPKPIFDALTDLVYFDDEQITDVLVRKRNLSNDLRIENPSPVLAEGISHGNEFLYIIVDESPNLEVIE